MLPGAAGKHYSCQEAGCLAGAGSLVPGILHGARPACSKRLPEQVLLPRLGSLERKPVAVTAELSHRGLGSEAQGSQLYFQEAQEHLLLILFPDKG